MIMSFPKLDKFYFIKTNISSYFFLNSSLSKLQDD